DTMKAVISRIALPSGDWAYPIAYFAEEPPPSAERHQPWAREVYQVVDDDGVPQGFSSKTDAWDFELGPWIEKGVVLWIAPDDGALKLRGAGDGPRPYERLKGEQRPQEVRDGERGYGEVPDGEALEPFE